MASLDSRDPAIKLFGKTIQLPANVEVEDVVLVDELLGKDDDLEVVEASSVDQVEDSDEEELEADPSTTNDILKTGTLSESPSPEKETTSETVKPQEEGEGETANNNGKEKPALKKPDKILPCPRCNSLDTKFCYYNNYNVNQPRHFCKNCQRYWTAGGTMRNVPVGAGRRKNKNSGSHYRHLTLADRSSDVHAEAMAAHRLPLKPNGTVLSFSPDAPLPLCESMSSVLNLAEKGMIKGCYGGGFVVQEEQSRGDHQSANSCVSASTNSSEDGNKANLRDQTTAAVAAGGCYPAFAQIPCFPPCPWAYPWNPAQFPPAAPPPFCSTSFPMPFFPAAAAYWGCPAAPPTWAGVPWISPPSPTASCVTGSNSPTLGKHSREENNAAAIKSDQTDQPEKCLWIPKTLRIDDPCDAAKSSIWSTLGINKEKYDGRISGTGLFKTFLSDESSPKSGGPSQILHANPAALSRSLTFQESS